MAVNNTAIPVYKEQFIRLNLGLRRIFPWVFLVANVTQPMLGADVLHHFALSVNVARRLLVDDSTPLCVRAIPTIPSPPFAIRDVRHLSVSSPYADLIHEYPSLLQLPDWTKPVHHDVVHRIETKGAPVFSRPRPMAPEKLKITKVEFQHMLDIGIARSSSAS
ncbi:uncharacterized protein LOC135373134 [Ornithodoros turicata]|uniref:uncharacterized protein LOC135373134 n=1 Tax=Ornithodoros turicata TaxID=34597 RepID=UPI0031390A69